MGGRMGPVGRFSLALGAVLALTAGSVALATAILIGTYVGDQTADQTARTVADHFGTVFAEDVFMRPLSADEFAFLDMVVRFHLGVYDIVGTRFYGPDGTVVFSYSPNDIGDRPEDPRVPATIAGARHAARESVLSDGRTVVPSASSATSAEHGHAGAVASGEGRMVETLEVWIPVRFPDGLRGAVVVWRDMAPIDAAVRTMQLWTSVIVGAGAVLLWFVLRGVYVRSSNEIRRRSRELADALAETERSYDATLHALSNALDVRDSETDGHAHRVVQYLELITDQLGLVAGDCTVLYRGALLHDVGKIGVPDEILRKAGPLTQTEWATMRRHPSYGARIIAGVPHLESVAAIIKHHHERWDGMGYPDGLRGEEIPLGARMFAVADAFDAMTADRPYRRALDPVSARAEIVANSGKQFDPRIVEAFMRIPLSRLLEIAPVPAAPAAATAVA